MPNGRDHRGKCIYREFWKIRILQVGWVGDFSLIFDCNSAYHVLLLQLTQVALSNHLKFATGRAFGFPLDFLSYFAISLLVTANTAPHVYRVWLVGFHLSVSLAVHAFPETCLCFPACDRREVDSASCAFCGRLIAGRCLPSRH